MVAGLCEDVAKAAAAGDGADFFGEGGGVEDCFGVGYAVAGFEHCAALCWLVGWLVCCWLGRRWGFRVLFAAADLGVFLTTAVTYGQLAGKSGRNRPAVPASAAAMEALSGARGVQPIALPTPLSPVA